MVFLWSYPPATADLPGVQGAPRRPRGVGRRGAPAREPQGQPDALVDRPLRAAQDDPRREDADVHPRRHHRDVEEGQGRARCSNIFGGENWTPNTNHPGLFKRAGTNHWAIYRWDPDAKDATGADGNFVERKAISFDEVLCGSIFGAPAATC